MLWTDSFSQDQSTEVPEEILQDADIRQAVECLQESAFTLGELETYDRYWDQVRVERTLLFDSLAEGEQIGLEKGRAEGRTEGERLGIEKAMSQALSRMVASGIPEPDAQGDQAREKRNRE